MALKTAQEIFFDIYFNSNGELDQDRFYNAVTEFEDRYKMRRPFTSYGSFKTSQKYYQDKKIQKF